MTDRETLKVYAEKAQDYAAMTDAQTMRDPSLQAFIAAMPKGGHVLDLGCGPGASAAHMARAGLKVEAYDPVPEMVTMAAQHDGVNARQASFEDVSGTGLFDGIWANFSLLHAPRENLPKLLNNISQALKPEGRFHIAVKTGTGSHRDKLGRLYTYYTEEELTRLLNIAGFSVIGRRDGCDPGLSGEEAHWIALAARRD